MVSFLQLGVPITYIGVSILSAVHYGIDGWPETLDRMEVDVADVEMGELCCFPVGVVVIVL